MVQLPFPSDEEERRVALAEVDAHAAAIEKIDATIGRLEVQRRKREKLLEKAELLSRGIKPCLVCNRHVKSPCNSRGGMMEHGPWDSFCREFMENPR